MKNIEDLFHEVSDVVLFPNSCDTEVYNLVEKYRPDFLNLSWDGELIRSLAEEIWIGEKVKAIESLIEGFNCQLVVSDGSLDFSFEFPAEYAAHALGYRIPKNCIGGDYQMSGWLELAGEGKSMMCEIVSRKFGDPQEAYRVGVDRLPFELVDTHNLTFVQVLEELVKKLTPVYSRCIMSHMVPVQITEDLYYEQLECLPPLVQQGSYYCSSEPVTHVDGQAYYFQAWVKDGNHMFDGSHWGAIGPMNRFSPFNKRDLDWKMTYEEFKERFFALTVDERQLLFKCFGWSSFVYTLDAVCELWNRQPNKTDNPKLQFLPLKFSQK